MTNWKDIHENFKNKNGTRFVLRLTGSRSSNSLENHSRNDSNNTSSVLTNHRSHLENSQDSYLSSLSWSSLRDLAFEQWKELNKIKKIKPNLVGQQLLANSSDWELTYTNEEKKQQRERINLLSAEIKELRKEIADKQEHNWYRIGEKPGNKFMNRVEQLENWLRRKEVTINAIKEEKSKLAEENKNLKKLVCSFQESKRLNNHGEKKQKWGLINGFQPEKAKQKKEELRKITFNSPSESSSVGNNSETLEMLQKKNEALEKEVQTLREKLNKVKQKELENLINTLKTKLEEDDWETLTDLLEAQEEFSKNNNSFVKKQLERGKRRLLRNSKLTEKEVENICETQNELTKLEIKNQLDNKIEIISK